MASASIAGQTKVNLPYRICRICRICNRSLESEYLSGFAYLLLKQSLVLVLNRPFGVIRLSDGARVGEKLDSKLAIVDVTVYGCSNRQILSIADNI